MIGLSASMNTGLSRRALLAGAAAMTAIGRGVPASAANSRPDLLIKDGRLLTMTALDGGERRADLLVSAGRIARIAPTITPLPGTQVINAAGMIVMPGFVDGHRHLWEGVLRAELPEVDLAGYLRLVNGRLGPVFSPEDAYLGTLVGALGAIDAGVTTVFDWSHIQLTPAHTDACVAALRDARLRAVFAYGQPPGGALSGSEWPQGLLRLRREGFAGADDLLTLALAVPGPEFVPDEVARAHFKLARDAGALISLHAAMEGVGKPAAIERFGRAGLLGADVNLVHCNALPHSAWLMVAETGTSVSITPSSEMQMGHGSPPIQAAREAGVLFALGVDVETSVPGDLWTQMRLAYAYQRERAFAAGRAGGPMPPLMTAVEALRYAIAGGARAARLDRRIGSLAEGREADLVLLRTDTINVMTTGTAAATVLVSMDARNVDTVLVAGRILKRKGHLVGFDVARLQQRIAASRRRIAVAAGAKS